MEAGKNGKELLKKNTGNRQDYRSSFFTIE